MTLKIYLWDLASSIETRLLNTLKNSGHRIKVGARLEEAQMSDLIIVDYMTSMKKKPLESFSMTRRNYIFVICK